LPSAGTSITLLPLWFLLPSANCQGQQNGSSCKLDSAKLPSLEPFGMLSLLSVLIAPS
jgi:hypothetical protein